MPGVEEQVGGRGPEVDGPGLDDLTAQALAADPDAPLPDDAVSFWTVAGTGDPDRDPLLPTWYMPAPMGGAGPLQGWRRRLALVVIAALVLITAYGLCNTYGQLGTG